jgi:DNA-binding NarL/FixJ family response regulator
MRIVLIEDHPVVRRGISQLLSEEAGIEVCGEAEDLATGLALITEKQPDIALVDLMLKNSSGFELLSELKQQKSDVKPIVLSMHAEADYVERALRAGARGYVTKDDADEKIIEAIHKVMAGGLYLDEAMSETVLQRLVSGPEKSLEDKVNELSQRERSVFMMMGQGKNSREIASRLGLNLKTVETYRRRIREKLEIPTTTRLAHAAFEFAQELKNI